MYMYMYLYVYVYLYILKETRIYKWLWWKKYKSHCA